MDDFVNDFENMGGSRLLMTAARILVENYVETGSKRGQSKFDIGPVLSMVSANVVDGLRTRIGGQTTARLNPNVFFSGYYAHGWKSRRDYYSAELTYSFNRKDNLPHEFPMRNITVSSTYDICTPTDKFLSTDKDNVLSSLKWARADKMMLRNRRQLKLVREEEWGLRTTVAFTSETDKACGSLRFDDFTTTEMRVELRYAPREVCQYQATPTDDKPRSPDCNIEPCDRFRRMAWRTISLQPHRGFVFQAYVDEELGKGRRECKSQGTVEPCAVYAFMYACIKCFLCDAK